MRGRACRGAPPRKPAAVHAGAAPSLPERRLEPRWITHSVLAIPDPKPRRNKPWDTGFAHSGDPSAAGTLFPASRAAAPRSLNPGPPDLEVRAQIRSPPR